MGLGGLDMEVDSCTFSAIRPAVDKGYWAAPVLAGYAYKHDSTKYAPAHDLTVNDCTFSVTGDKFVRRSGGVWIITTGTATVSDCTFTNIKGISVDGSNSCDGVPENFNPSSQDVTIRNCTFNGPSYPASVTYYMCGVNIQRGAQVDIENCTFNGFHDDDNSDGDGVCFCSAHLSTSYYTGSTGGSVTGCTFSDCVLGVYSGTTVTPLAINYNSFDGTNGYGVWNNDTVATIDATKNWWGDCSGPGPVGPGIGDSVSANVDYEPWLGQQLCELKSAIVALDDEDFTKPKRQTLLDKIDAVCGQIEDGAYRGALNKLERDIKRAIQRWIVPNEQGALIDMVDAEIEILEGAFE